MSVLGVGRLDGKGDKYEVQVFMILYDEVFQLHVHVYMHVHACMNDECMNVNMYYVCI